MRRIAVIMAGGAGERFWPLSRQARPKQLLKLTHPEMSLLEEAVERITPLVGRDNVWVATAADLVSAVRLAGVGVPEENIIGEPARRNTAGALAFVAAHARARFGEDPLSMAILTSDHRIEPAEAFRATVARALAAVEREGALGTIGIAPTRAETGYGYIEVMPQGGSDDGVWPVVRFREKPDRATAETFVAAGNYYWNSGMFFWRLDAFMNEMLEASPAHATAIEKMARAIGAANETALAGAFTDLPSISIDFALMEKARRVVMVRADFEWDDVGAWDALDRGWQKDAQGNVVVGEPVLIDARNNIVYNETGSQDMAVAAVGVEGLAIIVSKDGVLVVSKDRVQDVKQAVSALKTRGSRQI